MWLLMELNWNYKWANMNIEVIDVTKEQNLTHCNPQKFPFQLWAPISFFSLWPHDSKILCQRWEVRNIMLVACEILLWGNSSKHSVWTPVLQKYCSVAWLCPQEHRQSLVMQHGVGCSNYVAVLPLSPTPFCWGLQGAVSSLLMPSLAHTSPKALKTFSTIVTPQCFDLLPCLVFYQGLILHELGEDLLLLHKEDPCFLRIIIYESDIVRVSHERWRRRAHIRLNVPVPKSLRLCCLGPENMTWHTCQVCTPFTHHAQTHTVVVLWLSAEGSLMPHDASVPCVYA